MLDGPQQYFVKYSCNFKNSFTTDRKITAYHASMEGQTHKINYIGHDHHSLIGQKYHSSERTLDSYHKLSPELQDSLKKFYGDVIEWQ